MSPLGTCMLSPFPFSAPIKTKVAKYKYKIQTNYLVTGFGSTIPTFPLLYELLLTHHLAA